jgi:hypothetical protein
MTERLVPLQGGRMRTPSWKTRIEAAERTGYLTTSLHEDRAFQEWHAHCRANRLPFVHVQPSRHTADITLWMSPTGRMLTEAEQDRATTFDYQGGKELVISDVSVDIAGVPVGAVDRVAMFLRALADGPARPEPEAA